MRLTGPSVARLAALGVEDRGEPGPPASSTPANGGGRRGAPRIALLVLAAGLAATAGGSVAAPLRTVAASSAPPTTRASASADDWSELHPATAPLPRDSAVVAYDAASQTVVVSGGETGCGPSGREVYQDTWTWDGSQWKQVSTEAPGVFGVPNAYDPATGTVDVIWVPSCGDLVTSQWDGQTWTTTESETAPGYDQPAPYSEGAMAYDPAGNSLLLWSPGPGSVPGAASLPNDQPSTWSWDGSTWQPLSPDISPPSSIGGETRDVQMVDDAATGQMLLYGDPSQTMWTWDGTNWSQLTATGGPSPRVGASMVYDSALGEVLLFGGVAVTGYTPATATKGEAYTMGGPLNDLWAWSGGGWRQLHPATSPPARFYAQMAYDAASGQVLLFGGAVNTIADIADTWVYDPAT